MLLMEILSVFVLCLGYYLIGLGLIKYYFKLRIAMLSKTKERMGESVLSGEQGSRSDPGKNVKEDLKIWRPSEH